MSMLHRNILTPLIVAWKLFVGFGRYSILILEAAEKLSSWVAQGTTIENIFYDY